jgi:hypothetical protein
MKMINAIQEIEEKIQEIKNQMLALGPMHPGSISKQYHVCGQSGCRCKAATNPQRHGPYGKLRYVHQGKQVCRFVRPQWLEDLARQLEVYKTFRSLSDQWIAWSIQRARLAFFDAPDKKLLPDTPASTKKAPRIRKPKPQS